MKLRVQESARLTLAKFLYLILIPTNLGIHEIVDLGKCKIDLGKIPVPNPDPDPDPDPSQSRHLYNQQLLS